MCFWFSLSVMVYFLHSTPHDTFNQTIFKFNVCGSFTEGEGDVLTIRPYHLHFINSLPLADSLKDLSIRCKSHNYVNRHCNGHCFSEVSQCKLSSFRKLATLVKLLVLTPILSIYFMQELAGALRLCCTKLVNPATRYLHLCSPN